MTTTKSRFAFAALLAALSAPALADGTPACAVCGDPTWPTLDAPAPPLALPARGDEADVLRRADPTWPDVTVAAPSIELSPDAEARPQLDPAEPFAPERYSLKVGAVPAPRFATR